MGTAEREEEIDLLELAAAIWDRIWLVILLVVVGLALGIGYAKLLKTPQYASTTKVYVLGRQNNDQLTTNDINLSLQITKDYEELIKSRYVLDATIDSLNLDMDYKTLLKKISVQNVQDTRILSITVTDSQPEEAQRIAEKVQTISAKHITDVMKIQAVNVVDEANLPTDPVGSSARKFGILGALAGLVLSVLAIVLIYILDDTIRTSDDIEKYLGLSTLANVPLWKTESGGKQGKRSASRGKRLRSADT